MLKGEVRVEDVGVQEGDGNEEEQGDEEHSSSQYPQALRTVRECDYVHLRSTMADIEALHTPYLYSRTPLWTRWVCFI